MKIFNKIVIFMVCLSLTFCILSGCTVPEDNYQPSADEMFEFTELLEGDQVIGYSVKLSESQLNTQSEPSDGETDIELAIPYSHNELPILKIEDNAFKGSEFSKVIIPSTVVEIGANAFYNCKNLKKVIFNNGGKLMILSNYAFAYCGSLEDIALPQSLNKIGDYAFRYCTQIERLSMPVALNRLGTQAFFGCSGLKYVSVNANLKSVGEDVFTDCNERLSLSFKTTNKYLEIVDNKLVVKQAQEQVIE